MTKLETLMLAALNSERLARRALAHLYAHPSEVTLNNFRLAAAAADATYQDLLLFQSREHARHMAEGKN